MVKHGRGLVAAGCLAVVIGGQPAWGSEPGQPVVVRVQDYAGVTASILSSAEDEAGRIYAAAGVRVVWIMERATFDGASAIEVRVVILSPAMAEQKIANDQLDRATVGTALREARRAYIFYDRISAKANLHDSDVGILLGRVVAHELGHLLLPQAGHSDIGIMRATYDMRTLVQRFTPVQARAMRQIVSADRQALR